MHMNHVQLTLSLVCLCIRIADSANHTNSVQLNHFKTKILTRRDVSKEFDSDSSDSHNQPPVSGQSLSPLRRGFSRFSLKSPKRKRAKSSSFLEDLDMPPLALPPNILSSRPNTSRGFGTSSKGVSRGFGTNSKSGASSSRSLVDMAKKPTLPPLLLTRQAQLEDPTKSSNLFSSTSSTTPRYRLSLRPDFYDDDDDELEQSRKKRKQSGKNKSNTGSNHTNFVPPLNLLPRIRKQNFMDESENLKDTIEMASLMQILEQKSTSKTSKLLRVIPKDINQNTDRPVTSHSMKRPVQI